MKRLAYLALFSSAIAYSASGATWYVDRENPNELRDGTSWTAAYRSIQVAINAAVADTSSETDEVWVANGTYTETVTLQPGVGVFGGFAGNEWPSEKVAGRNPVLFKTVIDGEGTRQCVFGANDSTLDGFWIVNGKGNPSAGGGGMANVACSPAINNCIFTNNTSGFGGAIANTFGAPIITNCIFYENTALYGSAIYNFYASPKIVHCTLAHNTASQGAPNPTAIMNASSEMIIVNSILWNESLQEIYSDTDSEEVVVSNTIHGQEDDYAGLGNIHVDPLFFDTENNDFRLAPGSPCIDTASESPVATVPLPLSDMRGTLRTEGDGPDFGALEFMSDDPSDLDADGIRDTVEGLGDPDGDNIPNYLDEDSDNDGILDTDAGTTDIDGDGVPNFRDADIDGNGISNLDEGTVDTDADGIIDALDLDNDDDNIPDIGEGILDLDADELANYMDSDSDGDGIADRVEMVGDADRDGLSNYLDTDSDNNGVSDGDEGTGDQDGDGIPDYLDTNDLVRRITSDLNGDGKIDALDVQLVILLALGIEP